MNTLATDFSICIVLYSNIPQEIAEIIANFIIPKPPEIFKIKYPWCCSAHLSITYSILKKEMSKLPTSDEITRFEVMRPFHLSLLNCEPVLSRICFCLKLNLQSNLCAKINCVLSQYALEKYGRIFREPQDLINFISQVDDNNLDKAVEIYNICLEHQTPCIVL